MLAERGSCRQSVVISAEGRVLLSVNGDVEVAKQHVPELDVVQREVIRDQKSTAGEPHLGDIEELAYVLDSLRDGCMIPVGRCRPHDPPENWCREVHGDVELCPFRPLMDLGTRGALWRPEGRGPVAACQVAQDRPCFPERFSLPIAENGHGAVRVQSESGGRDECSLADANGEPHLGMNAAQDGEVAFPWESDDGFGTGLDVAGVEGELLGVDVRLMDEIGIVVDDGDVLAAPERDILRTEALALLRDDMLGVRQGRNGHIGQGN